jgi:hypothetical protein
MLNCIRDYYGRDRVRFRFIPEAKLSAQSHNANVAWKAITHLVKQVGLTLDVPLIWDDTAIAAHPTEATRMTF